MRSSGKRPAKPPPPPRRPATLDLYVTSPESADVLEQELRALGRRSESLVPGVQAVDVGALLDPVFALQVLPRAKLVEAKNANDLAGAILDAFAKADVVPAAVDVFTPVVERQGSQTLQKHPLEAARAALADTLQKKIEGRFKKHGTAFTPHRAQALLASSTAAWISSSPASAGAALLQWPAAFAGGRALAEEVVGAKDAPSSAHRKLDEALVWLGAVPGAGDAVVDLGAAPGGWSYVCLQNGADVTAVDRADLDAKLLTHKRLVHAKKDAFSFVIPPTTTWVLCDVIAEPRRSLELGKACLALPQLKAMLITLKLKRPVDVDLLLEARKIAATTPGFMGRVKKLAANKLEVSWMMRRA